MFDREIKEINSDIFILNKAAQKAIIQTERKFYSAFSVSNAQQSQQKAQRKTPLTSKSNSPLRAAINSSQASPCSGNPLPAFPWVLEWAVTAKFCHVHVTLCWRNSVFPEFENTLWTTAGFCCICLYLVLLHELLRAHAASL